MERLDQISCLKLFHGVAETSVLHRGGTTFHGMMGGTLGEGGYKPPA